MRIEGQLGGIAFLVRAELDDRGQPQGTFLAITPSAPLDDQHCFAWTAADSAETITARFSGDLGDLVRVVASETAELRIEPDQIALALSGMLGLEVAPATAERKLERMVQLANVLRGQVGPYR